MSLQEGQKKKKKAGAEKPETGSSSDQDGLLEAGLEVK